MEFLQLAREKMKLVELDEAFMNRSVNEGFSGGEKKRNEIFQMAVLEPRLAILDETDSGLDIDALRTVSAGVNAMRSPERGTLYEVLATADVIDRLRLDRYGELWCGHGSYSYLTPAPSEDLTLPPAA